MGFLTEAFYRMLSNESSYTEYTATRPSAYTWSVVTMRKKRVRYHCSRNGGRWK